MIAAITGCAFSANDALWAATEPRAAGEPQSALPYTNSDIDFLDDVAETILPRTDTPGARDAAVGQFIARYSAACYPPEHIALLKTGISDIEAQMQALQGKGFRQASGEARVSLLVSIDRQAKEHAKRAEATPGGGVPPHYFTLMKQLTLYGFFTSEPGETRVARYRPVPGRYKGCIPYIEGQTFWAW
jgi:Gluconate 2-dehydrogenase subunit 3